MSLERKPKLFDCPVEATIGVIGGKWKSVILFYLFNRGVMRFSELQRAIPKVRQQMLSAQLRELEADGLIHREVYPQVPPKVEYSITEFGRTLQPVIMAMMEWGMIYDVQHGQSREWSRLPPCQNTQMLNKKAK